MSIVPPDAFPPLLLSSGERVVALASHVTNQAMVAQEVPSGYQVGGLPAEAVIEVIGHLRGIDSPLLRNMALHCVPEQQGGEPISLAPPAQAQTSLCGTAFARAP